MIELVNTSLPNGLIAGTHGFATVALTKGVPDILRGKLEAFCVYAHRTSAHDATYWKENPVNFFHAVLPSGEHVVGRVAPSDFDYTGRTNRLARLRVFKTDEMPSIGAAAILAKESHWFTSPWEGEARWLSEDKATCGRLRLLSPVQASDAPRWTAAFGADGARLARRVAWQLERNLASAGKTIWFKATAAWDASGEKMLGLFADVINLLPPDLRGRVAFSTFSAALPHGTACHLRGIYDGDRAFDAASATQPWVDCAGAKIVHAEMLPEEAPSQGEAAISTGGSGVSPLRANKASKRRDAASPYGATSIIPPPSNRRDPFVVGMIAAMAVVLLGAIGGGVWFYLGEQVKAKAALGALRAARERQAEEEKRAKDEEERLAWERAEAAHKAQEEAEKKERQRAEKEEREREEKERLAQAEREAKEKEEADARAKAAEETTNAESKVSFRTAATVGIGTPPKPPLTKLDVSNETFKVCFYDGGELKEETAGFDPQFSRMNKSNVTNWALWVGKPSQKLKLLEGSPCVVWFKDGKAWYDWSHRKNRDSGERWFEKADSAVHDLQTDCFGPDERVFLRWHGAYPDFKYRVSRAGEVLAETSERELPFALMMRQIVRAEIKKCEKNLEEAQEEYARNTNMATNLGREIAELAGQTNGYADIKRELEDKKNKRPKEKDFTKGANDKKESKKRYHDAQKRFDEEANDLESKLKGIEGIMAEIKTKETRLRSINSTALAKKVDDAKAALEKAKHDPDSERRVRGMKFSVEVVPEEGKEVR